MAHSNILEFKLVTNAEGLLFTSDTVTDLKVFIGGGENDGSFLNNVKPALEIYLQNKGLKLTGIFAEVVAIHPISQEQRVLVQCEPA